MNRYYFTRVFAERMGCPPGSYRTGHPFLRKVPTFEPDERAESR